MTSLVYTAANSHNDLAGIIALQKNNLQLNLTREEIMEQGFVTVVHSYEALKKMNDMEQHIVCKDGDTVVAYLLAMTAASENDIPVLKPMFEIFDSIEYRGKPVSAYKYIVVGQVCVDKNYRGKGILDKCYAAYRESFHKKYDFAITEIATRNLRSVRAHQRIGFIEIHQYTSPDEEEWSIVAWQW
ncbi:GNAT family N-acetyltransferase [Ferruginibacter sp. SUN106]|uniref:GNAT family N-acetyltransferase n=1 Tax=Ferruginibacter sp. SUN106 TaxID=2978348 RepID=UPI003D36CF3C